MDKMKVKNSYIPWSFLDIVAKEENLFKKRDLEVDFFAVGRSEAEPSDKVQWYGDLVKGGNIDAYSVCAWGAIDRLAEKEREKIVAATTSSGYAFSILVAPGLGIKTAADLSDIPIAVNMKTGSHYCILSDLERTLPFSKIKVIHGAEPHNRLKGLLEGRFQAAALISPYTELAVQLGFVKVAETKTVDVLAFVARDDIPMPVLTRYLAALDEAAKMMKASPERFRGLYVRTLRETFMGFPDDWRTRINKLIDKMAPTIPITTWGELTEYPRESFNSLSTWMSKHNLLEADVSYDSMVMSQPLEKVQSG